jgi:multiple sugar transport system permease protein
MYGSGGEKESDGKERRFFMTKKTKQAGMSRALVRRETISGYLFLLPSLIFFLGFVIIPMILCIYTSFFDSNMNSNTPDVFIGFANYVELWQDPVFLKALKNTFIIVVVSVPTVTAFSLWVASVIYKLKMPLLSAFRCIFYLPVVTGSVAVTVVWKWMYNNYYGILNYIGTSTGVLDSNVNWLGNPKTALWCIIVILFTTSVGQPIVLYVSALGNVDATLVEAAAVDGANQLQSFWRIKWPQIMPTTLYILVITTINSFQCFALIQLLTSGGPNYSTETVMYYIYYSAFKLYRFGYGNAMGVVLAIFIALLSALQFRLAKEK